MTRTRRLAALAAAGAAALLAGPLLPAAPAAAHGALTNPESRTAVCGRGAGGAKPAACRAAIAVSGPQGLLAWDNLRVAGVDGRDRQVIPDGKLCSGGKPEYAGLDLARTDWPATKLTAGATFTFRYATTIPHAGTFRLYVTNGNYSPTKKLAWSAIEKQPFVTAKDPKVTGGAYTFKGKLPARTGRQIIYAIWQNSSSSDTYYSCSDVVFAAPKATPKPAETPGGVPTTPAGQAPAGDGGPPAADRGVGAIGPADPLTEPVARSEPLDPPGGHALPLVIAGAAGLAAAATGTTLVLRRRRRT